MHEIARKDYDRLSKESADAEKRHEELVEKLKKEIVSCVMNEELENLEPEEIRKVVDRKFCLNVRDEDLHESEEDLESEVDSESEDEIEDEDSEHVSDSENSEDENEYEMHEAMCRLYDG